MNRTATRDSQLALRAVGVGCLGEDGRCAPVITSGFLSSPEIMPAHLDFSQRNLGERREEVAVRGKRTVSRRDPVSRCVFPSGGGTGAGVFS